MEIIVAFIYSLSLLYLFLFSVSQLHLTWIYLRKKKAQSYNEEGPDSFEPAVTIQLPIYNEKYVIDRLLAAMSRIEYPKSKLEIQVLDDSTDETSDMIRQKVDDLKNLGFDIRHIHRTNRKGFKAGALDLGLQSATGEFIAVFDSDFIPEPDFLKKTLPWLKDTSIGAVQTRWGHINEGYSLLTKLQAFGLDAHFSIEQSARNHAGSFINFNGTCGVWRKQCMADAGGWSDDTLTEDLDLSYRAQLKGWKFKYLENVVTPGELPVIMPAIKSQQYRWNKGGAETARKLFGKVMRAKIPFINKVHSFFHLFNSSVFVALLLAAVSSIPLLYIKNLSPEIAWIFRAGSVFLFGFLSISFFYWTATKRFSAQPKRKFLYLFPYFLIISMGLSLHNGLAVLEGLLGIKSPFIRTPKFNITGNDSWKNNSYLNFRINLVTILEGLLCLYFFFGIMMGVLMKDNTLLLFHTMLSLGFGIVFYYSVRQAVNA